jgi:hypothetical protein
MIDEMRLHYLLKLLDKVEFLLNFVANSVWQESVKVAYINAIHSIVTEFLKGDKNE